jgi:glycine cleavage system regulatory protein
MMLSRRVSRLFPLAARVAVRGIKHDIASARGNPLVVTAAGPDRHGLVADISKVIVTAGGNIDESQHNELRGIFTTALLVSIDQADGAKLSSALQQALPEHQVAVHAARHNGTGPDIFLACLKLSMADHPGIVAKVAEVIAEQNLNVTRLSTGHEYAPFGGTECEHAPRTLQPAAAAPTPAHTRSLINALAPRTEPTQRPPSALSPRHGQPVPIMAAIHHAQALLDERRGLLQAEGQHRQAARHAARARERARRHDRD